MKKVCIITGANSGIGKQAALQIAHQGFHVIIACRSMERGQAALNELKQHGEPDIELMQVDMSMQSSIDKFADEVKGRFKTVDVLIHNAAHFDLAQKKPKITKEGIESVWATNHIGPVHLTFRLMECLLASDNARIITVASKGLTILPWTKVDFDDPEFKNRKFNVQKAYYQSKLAQVMFTYWLAEQLRGTPISVFCIRVTNVKIDVSSRYPDISRLQKIAYAQKSKLAISPEQMASAYTYIATDPQLDNATWFYFDENNEPVKSSKYSYDKDNIAALMKLTSKYTALPGIPED